MNDIESFGMWLKQRRRDLDLTQEALAEQAGCSVEMVRKIEAGSARASRQLVELLLTAVQAPAEEMPSLIQWARTGARDRRSAPLVSTKEKSAGVEPKLEALENPYKGLRAFQESDADDFFGREALTTRLLNRLRDDVELAHFLAVVGPSGSGKSSVVRAGLVPALRRGLLPDSQNWVLVEIIPGAHPLEELEAALLRVAVNPPSSLLPQLKEDQRGLLRAAKRVLPDDPSKELVLVIDQFEEVFTLVQDEQARSHFLDNIYTAVADPRSPVRVITTLRADFYDRPLLYSRPGELVRQRTEVVLPLAPDELERAIVRPAERVGVGLESNLLAAIVQDVSDQPGVLPLLQYALTELFELRERRLMTLSSYQASGGVTGALARRAEALYAEFSPVEREAARQLFLRLVTLGEGEDDTRRRVRRAELASAAPDESALDRVMELFGRYRLLTFDRDPITGGPTVEVAHEALLRTWGRLREWLDTSRESLRIHRRLLTAASEWTGSGRDSSFLAPGARLAQFETLAHEGSLALNSEERAYLEASVEERQRQIEVERQRQAQEVALQKRAANRLRWLTAVLAVSFLIAAGLSLFALSNQVEAESQRRRAEANTTQSEALRLAAEAKTLLQTGNQPELTALLGIHSMQTKYTAQGDEVLGQAATLEYPQQRFVGHGGSVMNGAVSTDGKLVLTGSWDSTARLWDARTGKEIRVFTGHQDHVMQVAFSPDSRTALTASFDGTARLWDVETGKELGRFTGHSGIVNSVAFSPDGKWIVTGGQDKTIRLWDTEIGNELRRLEGHTASVLNATVSPDGKLILTGSEDGTARLWNSTSGQQLHTFTDHNTSVWGLTFSPDSRTFITAGDDKVAHLWNAQNYTRLRTFAGHTDFVGAVSFSPDGTLIVTGSSDSTAVVWDVQTGQKLKTYKGHTAPVVGVAFSPDGKQVLTSGLDWTALLWDIQAPIESPTLSGHEGPVWSVGFSPDGKLAVTGGDDGTARLWDVATGKELRSFLGHTAAIETAVLSPDSKILLTSSGDGIARLWDVPTGAVLRTFSGPSDGLIGAALAQDGRTAIVGSADATARLWDVATGKELRTLSGHTKAVVGVAFSPDGKLLLTGSDDKTARLWDASTGVLLQTLAGHGDGVRLVAFSPDASTVATASSDKTVRLWDVATGKELRTFSGHTDVVYSVVFSPDGKSLLTGSWDKTARLWDVATGNETRRFSEQEGGISGVSYSSDGKLVLTAGMDGTARLWNSDYADTLRYLCSRLTRDFTQDERARYAIPDEKPTCSGL